MYYNFSQLKAIALQNELDNYLFSNYDFASNRTMAKSRGEALHKAFEDRYKSHERKYGTPDQNDSDRLWNISVERRLKLDKRFRNTKMAKENGGKLLRGEDINKARAARKRVGQVKSGVFPGGKGPNARPENKPQNKRNNDYYNSLLDEMGI